MKKEILLVALCVAFFISCSKGGDDPEITLDPVPGAVTLVKPSNGAVCVDNTYTWQPTISATSYMLSIFNNDGTMYQTHSVTSTTITLNDLPANFAHTWLVKAKNVVGETTSSIWSATTPGESVVNFVPSILGVDFSFDNDNVLITVKDEENDTMNFDAYSADTKTFNNATTYFENEQIADINLDNDPNTKQFYIEGIGLFLGKIFWLKIVLRDESRNQSALTTSIIFN